MNRIFLSSLLIVTAATIVTVPAGAAEPRSVSDSPYRLNPERAADYRLVEPYAAKPAERGEPLVPAQLTKRPYATLIHRAAHDAGLDPALVHAVIYVESRYNANARSPKGAVGLMQVLPQTALRYGVRNPARSPEANLRAGTQYLRDLIQQFEGHLDLVLTAYNAGEGAVLQHGGRIPPYRETQRYVPAVLSRYREWRELSSFIPAQVEYLPGTRLNTESSAE